MGDHIFISYSHANQAIVEQIVTLLQRSNITVWRDHERIPVGTPDWERSIRQGITTAQGVIYAASVDAAQSSYVHGELLIAKDNGILIYPLWIAGFKWSDCVPLGFAKVQYSDGRNDLTTGIQAVVDQVRNVHAAQEMPGMNRILTAHIRRFPVYLLLDCSEVMKGAPIIAINEGIELIYRELMRDPLARESVWMSIITFADKAVQHQLCSIDQFVPPTLVAGGARAMGAALMLLADSIEQDLVHDPMRIKGDYRPLVFLMNAGHPTDRFETQIVRMKSLPDNLEPVIVALGIGPKADIKVLSQITDDVYPMGNLTSDQLRAYFRLLD